MNMIEIAIVLEEGGETRRSRVTIDLHTWEMLHEETQMTMLVQSVRQLLRESGMDARWQVMQQRDQFTPDPAAVRPYQMMPPEVTLDQNLAEIRRQMDEAQARVYRPELTQRWVPNPDYLAQYAAIDADYRRQTQMFNTPPAPAPLAAPAALEEPALAGYIDGRDPNNRVPSVLHRREEPALTRSESGGGWFERGPDQPDQPVDTTQAIEAMRREEIPF